MNHIKVSNMKSHSGNDVPNQFIIVMGSDGEFFQSYQTLIGYRSYKTNKVWLDKEAWDYSTTTGKYRNLWLGEKKSETERKIKDGIYTLKDLNA